MWSNRDCQLHSYMWCVYIYTHDTENAHATPSHLDVFWDLSAIGRRSVLCALCVWASVRISELFVSFLCGGTRLHQERHPSASSKQNTQLPTIPNSCMWQNIVCILFVWRYASLDCFFNNIIHNSNVNKTHNTLLLFQHAQVSEYCRYCICVEVRV